MPMHLEMFHVRQQLHLTIESKAKHQADMNEIVADCWIFLDHDQKRNYDPRLPKFQQTG
jgi:hypothetical protein